MAIIKCKMCGGELNIVDASFVAECEYCGTKQTIPSLDDDKKLKMFERANKLRATCEFDKASGIYESIVEDYPEEAEAYWGLILCKYGIEYVDDPATGNKIPTCHRSSFDNVMDDPNFDMVMENADPIARSVYRDEAKQIEEIRKGIIQVSNQEQPYDIFICYKETDEYGERTVDSVIAQDVYDALIEKGYRVFFSRITLEDKLGQEYEPYIFAALNSAKVMLAFGTDYKYYNAVWVKNEWSRFIKLIASGQKKTLIPCYKGIDAYDMPKEFARLQAQDMGKVGAIQDLLRGLDKIFGRDAKPQNMAMGGINEDTSITRGKMCLDEKLWDKAIEYFEQAMSMNGESWEAYLGLFFADKKFKNFNEIHTYVESQFEASKPKTLKLNFDKKQREWNVFAIEKEVEGYLDSSEINALFKYNAEYQTVLDSYKSIETDIRAMLEDNQTLDKAIALMTEEKRQDTEGKISEIYDYISTRISSAQEAESNAEKTMIDKVELDFANAKNKAEQLCEDARERREQDYKKCCEEKDRYTASKDYDRLLKVGEAFKKFGKYKDSDKTAEYCISLAESKQKAIKKKKALIKWGVVGAVALIIIGIATVFVVTKKIIPDKKYNEAMKCVENGDYEKAFQLLEELGDYKGASDKISEIAIEESMKLFKEDKYDEGLALIESQGNTEWMNEYKYQCGCIYQEQENYQKAADIMLQIIDYKDANIIAGNCIYERVVQCRDLGLADQARELILKIPSCPENEELIKDANYQLAQAYEIVSESTMPLDNRWKAIEVYVSLGDYLDSEEKANELKYSYLKELCEDVDYYITYGYEEYGNYTMPSSRYDAYMSLSDFDYLDSQELHKKLMDLSDKITVFD